MLSRSEREARLRQRARVVWLYGLSGSGKSTLATALEQRLFADGYVTTLLDGDNLRDGLNRGLGFTDADRAENIRRVAEVSRLFVQSGIVCLNSFITPRESLRQLARDILGEEKSARDLRRMLLRNLPPARCERALQEGRGRSRPQLHRQGIELRAADSSRVDFEHGNHPAGAISRISIFFCSWTYSADALGFLVPRQ